LDKCRAELLGQSRPYQDNCQLAPHPVADTDSSGGSRPERRTRQDAVGKDMFTLLMSARDEAGEPFTNEELRDELATLLAAGHETTATALTWALYWIHKVPEVRPAIVDRASDSRPERSHCSFSTSLSECGMLRNAADVPRGYDYISTSHHCDG
jgi:hypothetical protein